MGDVATSFGSDLRSARARENMTQEQAAQRIGVTVRTYARWEAGANLPTGRSAERVEAVLGVTAPGAGEAAKGRQSVERRLRELRDDVDAMAEQMAVLVEALRESRATVALLRAGSGRPDS